MSVQPREQVSRDALTYALPRSQTDEWRMPPEWTPLSCRMAPKDMIWTPLDTYVNYPTKFPASRNAEQIRVLFCPENIHNLGAEVFYIWPATQTQGRPILLVPSGRLVALIQDINTVFPDSLTRLPEQSERLGLITKFDFHPHLYPRYLGFIRDPKSYHEIISRDELGAVPTKGILPRGEERTKALPSRKTLEDYIQKFNLIQGLLQSKKPVLESMEKMSLERQPSSPLRARPPSTVQKALERYLGLRPPKVFIDASIGDNWEQLQAAENARLAAAKTPEPINVALPPPFDRKETPIIIAFDIESYERDHRKVTEIGIATLDTKDLKGAPGTNGINWYDTIRSRHFRIKEHMHLVNRDFVHGCPDKFDFGFSEVIALKSAAEIVRACFEHPSPKEAGIPEQLSNSWDSSAKLLAWRKVVLVGHDPVGDIKWLSSLGFDIYGARNVDKTVVDTKILYRDMTQEKQFRSLAYILSKFDITAWNLHNAGNDATFTMQALLSIAVTRAVERGTDAQLARIRVSYEEEVERAARNAQRAQANNTKAAQSQRQHSESDGGVRIIPQYYSGYATSTHTSRRAGKKPVRERVDSEEEGEIDYI